ncbi:hypothetical protein PAHAL_8G172600 [Panicum hallii]|uniref:Uncharacterized protein n=1 Tax=Panicum hallii TaxID=206008 RepID=A0A2T8I941_9POAL|nr:hypothetical protein PAHAL_8G172600 [Panicum hallii]
MQSMLHPRRHAPPPPTAPCPTTATHGHRPLSSTRRRPPTPNAVGPNGRHRAAVPLPHRVAGPLPRTPLARIGDAGPPALLSQRRASTPVRLAACADARRPEADALTLGLRHRLLRPPALLPDTRSAPPSTAPAHAPLDARSGFWTEMCCSLHFS